MNTKLNVPIAVTRTVTNRIIVNLNHAGLLRLLDMHGAPVDSMQLAVGQPQQATYTLRSADFCGAAILQQSDWEIQCRAEAGIVLGNVDFPFLRDSTYYTYPQRERISVINAKFEKTATGAAIELWVDDGRGATRQRCEIPPPSGSGAQNIGFSVAFVAFTEMCGLEENKPGGGKQLRLCEMSAGGEITFTLPWQGGAPTTIQLLAAK